MKNLVLNKNQAVAFTGHRSIDSEIRTELRAAVENTIIYLYESGYRYFLNGMAMGFDLLAASVVITMKRRFPDIKLIAVVPYRNQSELFNYHEQQRCRGRAYRNRLH